MTTRRKQHSAQLKFKVALEAVKGEQTRNQIASGYSVHPRQVTEGIQWQRNSGTSVSSSYLLAWESVVGGVTSRY